MVRLKNRVQTQPRLIDFKLHETFTNTSSVWSYVLVTDDVWMTTGKCIAGFVYEKASSSCQGKPSRTDAITDQESISGQLPVSMEHIQFCQVPEMLSSQLQKMID
jgi:hypothetical protein